MLLRSWPVWLGAAVLLGSILGASALLLSLAQPGTAPLPPEVRKTVQPGSVDPVPRRLAVGGAPGFFVVIQPDGSSYLEKPDGTKNPLTFATPNLPSLVEKTAKQLTAPRKIKTGISQLIVCDSGVVDVPAGAIITYIGKDKVVTVDTQDGSSVIYYTDGRVERHARTERSDFSTPK